MIRGLRCRGAVRVHALRAMAVLVVMMDVLACSGTSTPPTSRADSTKSPARVESLSPEASSRAESPLLASLQDSLRGIKPAATSISLVALRPGYFFPGYFAVVLLRGPGFGTNPTTASGEVYAVVRLDSTLTHSEALLDTFPTQRTGDYTVWFRPGTSSDPLVVCGEGSSYGDQRMRRGIKLDPRDSRRADRVIVDKGLELTEWSSQHGCGITADPPDPSD